MNQAEIKALLARPTGRVRGVAAKALRTYNGVVYHSKGEALHAFELDRQKAAGMIYEWERQIPMPIRINGVPVCVCVVDFRVKDTPASEWRYVEIKGKWETEISKLKRKMLLAMYGREFRYELVRV